MAWPNLLVQLKVAALVLAKHAPAICTEAAAHPALDAQLRRLHDLWLAAGLASPATPLALCRTSVLALAFVAVVALPLAVAWAVHARRAAGPARLREALRRRGAPRHRPRRAVWVLHETSYQGLHPLQPPIAE